MTDEELVGLYFSRSEEAIEATRQRYGPYCRAIIHTILGDPQDEEECLGDVWLRVWDMIPPHRPDHFKGWLGAVARNCALTFCRRRERLPETLEEAALELAEDLTGGPQERLEGKALGEAISRCLEAQPPQRRIVFLRRYWYGDTVEQAASRVGWSTGKTKTVLFRMRNKLKDYLKREELYDG